MKLANAFEPVQDGSTCVYGLWTLIPPAKSVIDGLSERRLIVGRSCISSRARLRNTRPAFIAPSPTAGCGARERDLREVHRGWCGDVCVIWLAAVEEGRIDLLDIDAAVLHRLECNWPAPSACARRRRGLAKGRE